MSELPRTQDAPLDAARVEEAFATLATRVRELEAVASELRIELRALRAERAPGFLDEEEWPVAGHNVSPRSSRRSPGRSGSEGLEPDWLEPENDWAEPEWVGAVPPPLRRPTAAPRLLLETAFLVLIALLAGLADLSAAWIVVVMGSSWALVALSEWAAAAKRARWRLEEVAAPAVAGTVEETTGPWAMPVVHATVVEAPDESESHTVIASPPESVVGPAGAAEPADPVAEVAEADAGRAEAGRAEAADDEADGDVAAADSDGAGPAANPAALPPAAAAVEPQEPEVAGGPQRRGLRFWRRETVEPAKDPWEA